MSVEITSLLWVLSDSKHVVLLLILLATSLKLVDFSSRGRNELHKTVCLATSLDHWINHVPIIVPLAAWWTEDWERTREKEGVWIYGDDCTGIFVMSVCRENICRLYHGHVIHASSISLRMLCCFIFSPNFCSRQGQIFCKPKCSNPTCICGAAKIA